MVMSRAEVDQLQPDALPLLETYRNGEHSALLAEVDQRSRSGPLPPDVLGLAAASLVALERYEEAATAAREAAGRAPRKAWLYHVLSRAELGRGDRARALEAAEAACRLLPGHPDYLATLAACRRENGDPAAAAATARQALLSAPDHPGALNQLGLALAASGDEAAALEQFTRAMEAAPQEPEAYLNAAALHRKAGRVPEARRVLKDALRHIPGLLEAEEQLAGTVGSSPLVHGLLRHLIHLSRLTMTGWLIVAFIYYLFFRLLEFLWKYFPVLLPVSRVLLLVAAAWLLGGALCGRLLRLALRRG
ncbi:tetratricopeptide (TPR) repeat protein [Symbiobacterium terraclitae]|uniref:Tetratricopeptide (TPR) repeat protein n=1 Tax=Symbiobacterium terraclitae TaxID=557451 RepID=A0ABS4JWN6_9FIRM|nr:tetratricopeptide repeat protein [Symbiobacterium terraclitae]MBP2019916.1 tetratricopeptide (TPR) repeat protein [Symbiobacterium terraclitae]